MPSYTAQEPKHFTDPLPPGTYQVKVIEAEETQSKNGGNPMIELTLLEKTKRATIFDRLVFTEKAFFRIDQFRSSTGDTVKPGEEVEIDRDYCKGRVGWVELDVEEYNGRKKNVVKYWLSPEPGAKETSRPSMPAPKPAPKSAPDPAPEDLAPDDIPF